MKVKRPSDDLIKRDLTRQYSQDKYNKMKVIVIEQLQEYSKSGERLHKISNVVIRSEDAIQYAKLILEEIFRDRSKSEIIYDLIFGRACTSYQKVSIDCNNAGFKLKTTPSEWFKLVKNRKNSGKGMKRELKVKVECKRNGHETYKTIETIDRFGCKICGGLIGSENLPRKTIEYDKLLNLIEDTPFKLISTKKQFKDAINEAKSKGKRSNYAYLEWRHECGHEFIRTYHNFIRYFSCPKCNQWKNQKITHIFCEYAFDCPFEVEKSMRKIFNIEKNPEIKDLHDNVHIDIFQELSDLRDKNGNIIMLGVRYNGKQHDNNPEGFDTYKKIVGSPNEEYRSERWRFLWKNWRKLIKTDEIKRTIFVKNKKYGYYLIEVDYRIPPSLRLSYITSEFERKTGVKLPNKENVDWRELLYKYKS